MKTPGIAEKVFMPSPNSLIVFSESATSIVPLDSVTVALEDELNKVEAVANQFLFQTPNPLSNDYQCLQ